METTLLFFAPLTIFLILLLQKFSTPRKYHLPPRPAAALPIIGHLHLLKRPLHRNLHSLAQTAGPIISLTLGIRRCVVVTSPTLVEECFTKNDLVLAGRPRVLVDKYLGYNHRSLVGASYGDHWRRVRRITSQELLSAAALNRSPHIRSDEIKRLLLSLKKTSPSAQGFCKVELRSKLTELSFNVLTRMVAGKTYFSCGEKGDKFQKVIKDVFEVAQAENPQDFLPFLQLFDYGGFRKKLACLAKEMDEFLQRLVDDHRHDQKRNTMIGHLLGLQESEPQFYSDETIKATIMSTLVAGTDTSSVTIEWAMSILLNHPRVLEKARTELETKIGIHRLIDEEDLPNLPYLQHVIMETLRLFPAAPLLVAHEASQDCKIGGYDVPRGTILFVNAWAIHRDPEVWEDATSFKPERFEGKEVQTHKLMPFGMGRRACPGAGLAQRVVGMALGTLIQCFEWKRVGLEEVDLTEGEGITMPKLKPLEAMCKPKDFTHKLLLEAN